MLGDRDLTHSIVSPEAGPVMVNPDSSSAGDVSGWKLMVPPLQNRNDAQLEADASVVPS